MVQYFEAGQMNFSDQFFHPDDDPIPETHPYVSLSRELDWDEIVLQLSEFYCEDIGRPGTPIKNMVLLLMFKHLDGYSDRELIEMIAGSMPMQKALNIPFKMAQKYIDHSSLSKFRERIGEKGLSYINQAVESLVKKKRRKKVVRSTLIQP